MLADSVLKRLHLFSWPHALRGQDAKPFSLPPLSKLFPMSYVRKHSRYIPKHVREAVRARERDRCRNCGAKSEHMEFDHMTPHSKGAPATIDNIQLLCRKCNLAKRDKTPKCSRCGNWIPHDASFCQKCGSRQYLQHSRNEGWDGRAVVRKVIGTLLLLYVIIYLLSHH